MGVPPHAFTSASSRPMGNAVSIPIGRGASVGPMPAGRSAARAASTRNHTAERQKAASALPFYLTRVGPYTHRRRCKNDRTTPLQGLRARLRRLEEAVSNTLPFKLEPLTPSDWGAIVQRAMADPRTIDERLEELRRPTVSQDPRSPMEHERCHEDIEAYWAEVFERLGGEP